MAYRWFRCYSFVVYEVVKRVKECHVLSGLCRIKRGTVGVCNNRVGAEVMFY